MTYNNRNPQQLLSDALATRRRRFVVPNMIDREAPVVRKPWPTFADVLRTYDPEYRRRYGAELTEQQDKVLREMLACYTPVLGTHKWTCGDCGTVLELPNGCNNRHCCTCGAAKRRRWADKGWYQRVVPRSLMAGLLFTLCLGLVANAEEEKTSAETEKASLNRSNEESVRIYTLRYTSPEIAQ
jgi:hypothetical protein